MILLIVRILETLSMPCPLTHHLDKAHHWALLMRSQLIFTESFVEDLLNLHLIQKETLKLDIGAFSPQKAIDFVVEIFQMKAKF